MLYEISITKMYKKERNKLNKNDIELLDQIIFKLASGEQLEPKYKDHKLKGEIKTLENVISNQTYCLSIKNKKIY